MSDLVTAPSVLLDLPDHVYHGDKSSLSSTGARLLLDKSPKAFRWQLDHGRPPTKAFDLGHVVHTKILGRGMPGRVPVDEHGEPYAMWNSNASKAAVAEIREAGLVPLKADEYALAVGMADAVLTHDLAGRLFAAGGVPEQSLFAQDPHTGVWLRARPDWTIPLGLVDLKSARDASAKGFEKASGEHRYDQQDPWYRDLAVRLGIAEAPAFMFVMVEKDPPHDVGVYQLDDDDVARGAARNRRAIDLYAECVESGRWPGYAEEVVTVSLPPWIAA